MLLHDERNHACRPDSAKMFKSDEFAAESVIDKEMECKQQEERTHKIFDICGKKEEEKNSPSWCNFIVHFVQFIVDRPFISFTLINCFATRRISN